MHLFSILMTAGLLLLTPTTSHMLLQTPLRFPSQLTTSSFNGPLSTTLSGSPSNYPCHLNSMPNNYALCNTDGTGAYTCINRTVLTRGSNFTMSFIGESVHGGGSCQVSLTKDLEPGRDSVFKVIHSIVGGCPARDTPGNIGSDSSWSAPDPNTYDFVVPEGLEEGNYTFAWTWFNKVGNREMYMNCAPVIIQSNASSSSTTTTTTTSSNSSSSDDTFFTSLPNLFLANIPDVPSCASPPSGQTMLFPDPGTNVEHNNAGDVFAAPIISDNANCYAPLAAQADVAGSNTGISTNIGTSSTLATSAASTVSSPSPTSSVATGTSLEASSSNPSTALTTSTVLVSPIAATSVASQPITTTPTSSTLCAHPCTTPGALICIDLLHFGLCTTSLCAVPQDVAAGTECQGGGIVRRAGKVGLVVVDEDEGDGGGGGGGGGGGLLGGVLGGVLGKREADMDMDVTDVFVGSNGRGGVRLRGRMGLGERRMRGVGRG